MGVLVLGVATANTLLATGAGAAPVVVHAVVVLGGLGPLLVGLAATV